MTVNPGRISSDKQRLSLKMAVKRALEFCGTAVAAAGLTRVNVKRLSDYVTPQEEERHCPIDVALDLDLAAGQPVITAALASLQGYRLVRAEPFGRAASLSLEDLRRLLSEARDVELALIDAIEDGRISGNDKRCLLKEIGELRAALDGIEAKVEES